MKKIFLGISIVVILCVGLYFFLKNENQANPEPDGVSFPSPVSTESTQQVIFSLKERSGGGSVDFGVIQQKDVQQLASDYYKLFAPSNPSETPLYSMYFNESDQTVLIVLQREPIALARQQAINRIKQELAISSNDALCGVDISVITNSFVNPQFSGRELGIPGCPGAVALE